MTSYIAVPASRTSALIGTLAAIIPERPIGLTDRPRELAVAIRRGHFRVTDSGIEP